MSLLKSKNTRKINFYRNVTGKRLSMAMLLKTRAYDIFMIVLIVVYTLIVLL
jgi:hypothetical protein